MPTETVPVLLVRLLPGVVGESRRVVHVVPVPASDEVPGVLTAYCGEQITPGDAERLDRPAGMPCTPCLIKAPSSNTNELGGQWMPGVFRNLQHWVPDGAPAHYSRAGRTYYAAPPCHAPCLEAPATSVTWKCWLKCEQCATACTGTGDAGISCDPSLLSRQPGRGAPIAHVLTSQEPVLALKETVIDKEGIEMTKAFAPTPFAEDPVASASARFPLSRPMGMEPGQDIPSPVGIRPWNLRHMTAPPAKARTLPQWRYDHERQEAVTLDGVSLVEITDATAHSVTNLDGDEGVSEDWKYDFAPDFPGSPT